MPRCHRIHPHPAASLAPPLSPLPLPIPEVDVPAHAFMDHGQTQLNFFPDYYLMLLTTNAGFDSKAWESARFAKGYWGSEYPQGIFLSLITTPCFLPSGSSFPSGRKQMAGSQTPGFFLFVLLFWTRHGRDNRQLPCS